MRMLVKIQVPAMDGNIGVKERTFQKLVDLFNTEFNPEAIYFLAQDGMRTALIFVDMQETAQIPEMAEPWFQSMNAKIEITPVMIPADLAKASPAIDNAIKKFGH